MRIKTPLRGWEEISNFDRSLRLLTYVGGAAFVAFWLISAWLEMMASLHPYAPSGIFQYSYSYKGRIGYITESQDRIAHVANVLAFGWVLAFGAGVWGMSRERRVLNAAPGSYFNRANPTRPGRADVQSNLLSSIRSLNFRSKVRLVTSLPINECLSKMDYVLQLEAMSVKSEIVGHRLTARPMLSYRNDMQRSLSANFSEIAHGTLVDCRFSMPFFVKGFLTLWFGAILLFFLLPITTFFGVPTVHWDTASGPLNMLIFSFILLIFGLCLLFFCLNLSRDGEDFLLMVIRNTIKANEISAETDIP